jgi:hypothetical protein
MPGLGDTGVGAEDRLVAALGEHIDVVLFVLMPTPAGGILADVDFGLYDLAYQALDGIPIDRWSYMVLNRTYPSSANIAAGSYPEEPRFGDNYQNCERIKDMIMAGNAGIADRRIKVVNCIITDCSKPADAKDKILEEALTYLVQSISDLDTMYMSSWQKRLAELQAEITRELEQAHLTLNAALSQSMDDHLFEALFTALWGELTTSLDALLFRLARESRTPNSTFVSYFRETFTKCRNDTALPSLEEIKFDRGNMNAYMSALNKSLDAMRTHLTHHFVDMDESLKLTMNDVKASVADVLLEKGQLIGLLKGKLHSELFNVLAVQEMLSPRLRKIFLVFAKYELSLRGFFQSRIRQRLDRMTPDKANVRIETLTPEEVLRILKESHAQTVTDIEKTLNIFLYEPNDAAIAIVEEFADQAFRSKGTKETWRAFYRTNKAKIWSAEFEPSVQWEEFQREWRTRVQRAVEVNNATDLATFTSFSARGGMY